MGTPSGFCQSGSAEGIWPQLMVKRALGCAALRPAPGVHGLPCQSVSSFGGCLVRPSHQTSPSGVSATLVNIVSCSTAFRQFGLVNSDVPGATPNAPASGLIAYNRPSLPGLIQAMSSPIVVTFHPFSPKTLGGTSIARLVLPHALGNAA